MPDDRELKPIVPYAPKPGTPRSPPHLAEVGWGSALVGAVLFGVVLPCGGFQYASEHFVSVGSIVLWPVIAFVGCVTGGVIVPLVVLGIYWLVWRLAGRP